MAADDDVLVDTGDMWGPEVVPYGPLPPPIDVLATDRENAPAWLEKAGELDAQTFALFCSSRVVFYPGSGNDGQAIELFGHARAACCFVHADYLIGTDEIKSQLDPSHPHRLRGYAPSVTQTFLPSEFPMLPRLDLARRFGGEHEPTSVLWSVLGRMDGFPADHGPDRIAFMHFTADAVWTYWNLWAHFNAAPYAVLLQDHGFGCNWSPFGDGGELHRVAMNAGSLPGWLLVGENTLPWGVYVGVSEPSEPAGMHGHRRGLFTRFPANG